MSFIAYEIISSTYIETEDIKRLESCFFEIPPTNRTSYPSEVRQLHKELLFGELFENLFCEGILVKVASGKSKIVLALIQNVTTVL